MTEKKLNSRGRQVRADSDILRVVSEDQALEVTLSGLDIKDSYLCNKKGEKNISEYEWSVNFSDGNHNYKLNTVSWRDNPGKNEKKTIEQMQHWFWISYDGNSYSGITKLIIQVSENRDAITWQVEVPEEYQIDWQNVKTFSASQYNAYNTSENKNIVVPSPAA